MKYKTREELLAVPMGRVDGSGGVAQSALKESPDMTLEKAIELLDMIP
jgi:hypothetical protein